MHGLKHFIHLDLFRYFAIEELFQCFFYCWNTTEYKHYNWYLKLFVKIEILFIIFNTLYLETLLCYMYMQTFKYVLL